MKFGLRAATRLCLLLALACLTGCQQTGDIARTKFPRKNLKIICPWAPGGGTDRVARFWADALETSLERPCIVVNKTGGSEVPLGLSISHVWPAAGAPMAVPGSSKNGVASSLSS